jgi:HD-GYP domain-containing protein (c-di-GMP phosphodiesterase class II)
VAIQDITARKQVEANLEESERTARALLNASASTNLLIDPTGRLLAGNQQLARYFNRPLDQLVGRSIYDLFPPEMTLGMRLRIQKVLETRSPLNFVDENRAQPAHLGPGHVGPGHVGPRTLDTLIYPIFDSAGRVTRIAISVTDVTAYRQAERSERQQRQQAESLLATSEALAQAMDLDTVFDVVVDNIKTLVPNASINIMLVEDGPAGPQATSVRYCEPECGHPTGRHTPIGGRSFTLPLRATDNLVEMTASLQPVIIHDTHQYPGWLPNPAHPVRSQVAVPILFGREPVGFLCLESPQPNFFNEQYATLLRQFAGQAAVSILKARIFTALQASHQELAGAYDATIEGWARALELRDKETEGHSRRVVEITCRLAGRMGISGESLANIRWGAQLHDIGKMGIPDNILLKPEPLTDEEWNIMRQHPILAYQMLSGIAYLRDALDIPLYHHERWDGSGYPYGLSGLNIPMAARIFSVVDAFDALLAQRPYRPAWPLDEVLAYLRIHAEKQFDPHMVDAFFELLEATPTLIEDLYTK